MNSQNYQSARDAFDNQAADDFVIPPHTKWTIKRVRVLGRYVAIEPASAGPASSVNVFFYDTKRVGVPGRRGRTRVPGKKVAEFKELAPTDITDPSFTIDLPAGSEPSLGRGRWWVSVQVNQDSSTNGLWAWQATPVSPTTFDEGAWLQPGDGNGTGCTDWRPLSFCLFEDRPKQLFFALEGSSETP